MAGNFGVAALFGGKNTACKQTDGSGAGKFFVPSVSSAVIKSTPARNLDPIFILKEVAISNQNFYRNCLN